MNAVATHTCEARIAGLPTWAPRHGARCGQKALDAFAATIHVDGQGLVELRLCGLHYEVLYRAPDPNALAREWAP